MTTSLSLASMTTHRVACDRCGYDRIHADVRDAVNDYVDHKCSEESK